MTMTRFRLTKRAEADVAEIRRYIAKDNESAANRFVGELFDLFQSLGRNPEIGQIRPELRPDLRSFSHGNYVVLYYSESDRAEIVGVVHGARDIEAILRQEVP
jgi:toxin ParE1/3/4